MTHDYFVCMNPDCIFVSYPLNYHIRENSASYIFCNCIRSIWKGIADCVEMSHGNSFTRSNIVCSINKTFSGDIVQRRGRNSFPFFYPWINFRAQKSKSSSEKTCLALLQGVLFHRISLMTKWWRNSPVNEIRLYSIRCSEFTGYDVFLRQNAGNEPTGKDICL